MPVRAIIVVTGATSGVGLGICERLIDQLCYAYPPDVADAASTLDGGDFFPCEELTLILPCRSMARGEKARERLLERARRQLRMLVRNPEFASHAQRFVSALKIDVLYCDLAIIESVIEFGKVVSRKYPYITHVINNAGVGSFIGIHVVKGLIELVRNPVRAVTAPNYKIEVKGEISADGLGWVWQCNVFGHYAMYRGLLPTLRKSPFHTSRVIWMSSLEALRDVYDPNDFQLTETEMPYEGSKCQMDLLAVTLDRNLVTSAPDSGPAVRHMVVQPGVVDTNILGATQIGFLLQWLKIISFYFVRFIFSQNHTIHPYVAAISAVFASLTPQIPTLNKTQIEQDFEPIKYHSKTNWKGAAFVTNGEIDVWPGNEKNGRRLVEQMDNLYKEFIQSSSPNGSA